MFGSRSAIPVRRALPPLRVDLEELREPGHVPTPPRPQTGFACGRLSPRSRPQLFEVQKIRCLLANFSISDDASRRLKTERNAKATLGDVENLWKLFVLSSAHP